MKTCRVLAAALLGATAFGGGAHAAPRPAGERVPLSAVIADQGFNHSQAVDVAEALTDEIGARLTNSPAMRRAETWALGRLRGWGLADVRREAFDFGRGWEVRHATAAMVAPRPLDLHTIPVAWTPGTSGPVQAPVVMAPMRSAEDFAAWRGKLAGRIVLVSTASDPVDDTRPSFHRVTDSDLAEHAGFDPPAYDPAVRDSRVAHDRFAVARDAFLKAEGALGWVRMSTHENGLVSGEGYQFRSGHTPALPALEMAAEDYRRLARLAIRGPVTLRIDTAVAFHDEDANGYNILADLPGRDASPGYVMAGAHLDSWTAADGATDNGAGVAVVMEAARILAEAHARPRRTIRFALWSGEEQGLLGSSAYVARHLASRPPEPEADKRLFGPSDSQTWPITPLPGYGDMAAYFNVDNGAGRFRGVFAAGNLAAMPQLQAWLAPFQPMGAATVLAASNDGSDQEAFTDVGLAAFQFIQDPLDYRWVHHTGLDTFDHLRPDDLRQAAVILATVLMDAADAEQPLPRPPTPTRPTPPSAFERR